MVQMLYDLFAAWLFVSLAVASYVDVGLVGANICYLTQINSQTQRGGKWSRTGQQRFGFCNGLQRRRLQNQF